MNQVSKATEIYPFEIIGGNSLEQCSSVVFHRNAEKSLLKEIKVSFADYFITGFPGFDFHKKWNNDIAPPCREMYGMIIKETEKMYKFKLHSADMSNMWEGWCPKKSCTVVR